MTWFGNYLGSGKKAASIGPGTKTLREGRALKSKLQEATKHVPKYLFRMWHTGSGGNSKLNTTEKVTPHAFFKEAGHTSVYMSVEDFVDNIVRHLGTDHGVLSEISSWSASPRFAFHYATKHRESACIAIIDTLGLQEGDKNVMFHVPALQPIFGHPVARRGPYYDTYNWEYLVHGVIEGKHYKAVRFRSLCENGLTEHLPALKDFVNAWGADKFTLPTMIVPFSTRELRELNKIAKLFGSDSEMSTALTIAMFCCKRRTSLSTELEKKRTGRPCPLPWRPRQCPS